MDFALIQPDAITPEEWVRLVQSIKNDNWNQESPKDFITKPGTIIYRVIGEDVEGLIICCVFRRSDGPTLFVKQLVGKGMLKRSAEIMDMVRRLAKALECSTVTCTVTRRGLVQHYQERLGFAVESANMIMEV